MMGDKIWHESSEIPTFGVSVALVVRTRLAQNFGKCKDMMIRSFHDKKHYDQICRWEEVLMWAYTIDLIPKDKDEIEVDEFCKKCGLL